MESIAGRRATRWPRDLPYPDPSAVSAWALAGAIVLYMGIDGGGYDVIVHSQVGIVAWWIVLVGAAWGLLPAGRLGRSAWAALALFGGFVSWTALASTWSLSSERSLGQLSLVACYLGILVLAVGMHRDRERAVRHTVNAAGTAVVVIACLALGSRLRPDLFPAAGQTGAYLPGAQGRLGWPLNYWNALGALIALGLPLLLAIATSARTLRAQAAAAAAIPLLALCGYLTFSRGGAIAGAIALLAFLALAPERIPKLATAVAAAGGSAALIAGAVHRSAIEQGLTGGVARHQGDTLLVAILLVCSGVALAQTGIGLAVRHGTPPRLLVISRRRARWLLLGGLLACTIAALAAGVPGRLSHAWQEFKHPNAAVLHQQVIGRFGSASGSGRYDFWRVAVNATGGHVLGGSGPGTFQLLWLPRAPFLSYAQNTHSLYLETLSETGIIGLGLLLGFLALALGAAIRVVLRARHEARARAAGLAAALVAFCVSAAADWVWQVPVLPAAFMLLAAAALAPPLRPAAGIDARARRALRLGAVVVALACMIAIAVPMATTSALRQSQAASSRGNPALALAAARTAARLEPGAATPQIQLAEVLERQGDVPGALAAAQHAVRDEPANWSSWLIASRLQAEAGHPASSLAAYRRARALNPRSLLFQR